VKQNKLDRGSESMNEEKTVVITSWIVAVCTVITTVVAVITLLVK
jgi:hypothetical protein